MRAALPAYLRSLWNVAPALLDLPAAQATRSSISPLGLHLPPQCPPGLPPALSADLWWQATAAHAAAHIVFTRHRFDPAGLGPIPRTLLGLLEDARVEWLACRELPGLRRLWLRFHGLQPHSALPGVEELLARLAHALLDPTHPDAHPWVAKGRRLFYADDQGQALALRRPEALRQAATRLGHDLGQLRLGFNARQYCVAPDYRDDHGVLWLADAAAPSGAEELGEVGALSGTAPTAPAVAPVLRQRVDEWDCRVPLRRPGWCTVLEAPADSFAPVSQPMPLPRRPAAPWGATRRRQRDGRAFDLDALVDAGVALRRGSPPPAALYLRRQPAARPTEGLILIDHSASTAQGLPGGASLLDLARQAAWHTAAGWSRSAIAASCSDGRHAVHYLLVKRFDQPLDQACWRRLGGLRSRLSTRLGSALRHAGAGLAARRAARPRLLLLTDGRPQDIDVFDPRYLPEDARQAVREARRRGLRVQCLCLDAAMVKPLSRIFGAGQVQCLYSPVGLPLALARLEAALD